MQCICAGTGRPPLVFVHGVGCSRTDWQLRIDHFSKQHAVAACDLRGHGETPGDAALCSIKADRADVAAVLAPPDLCGAVLVIQSTCLNADRVRVSMAPGDDAPWLQTVRRLAPSVRIETVPGVGHFPQLEAPDHVNRLIASFLGTG